MNPIKIEPIKPTIPFEIFEQIDIRVGTIDNVEDIPKSRSLVKLLVDFGDHRRNIIAGMKQERSNPK